jgi:hypothetical protein
LALSGGRDQAELAAKVCQIDLAQRLGTRGNICNRQPKIGFVANPTDRSHRGIEPHGRRQPLLDSRCDHQTREAWEGLPRRGIENRARSLSTRKSSRADDIFHPQTARFMNANIRHGRRPGSTLNDQMDHFRFARETFESGKLH